MNKHTPGPWRIGNLGSYDGYGQPYRNVWAGKGESETVVARAIRWRGAMTNDVDADAALIAAAPELLEAWQILAEHDFGVNGWTPLLESAAIKGRAAIRKATGE